MISTVSTRRTVKQSLPPSVLNVERVTQRHAVTLKPQRGYVCLKVSVFLFNVTLTSSLSGKRKDKGTS